MLILICVYIERERERISLSESDLYELSEESYFNKSQQ